MYSTQYSSASRPINEASEKSSSLTFHVFPEQYKVAAVWPSHFESEVFNVGQERVLENLTCETESTRITNSKINRLVCKGSFLEVHNSRITNLQTDGDVAIFNSTIDDLKAENILLSHNCVVREVKAKQVVYSTPELQFQRFSTQESSGPRQQLERLVREQQRAASTHVQGPFLGAPNLGSSPPG